MPQKILNKGDTMTERVFKFYEPHPTGGDCTVEITESKIVKHMKDSGIKEKIQKKHPDMDVTDKILIEDFCTVHWASEKKS